MNAQGACGALPVSPEVPDHLGVRHVGRTRVAVGAEGSRLHGERLPDESAAKRELALLTGDRDTAPAERLHLDDLAVRDHGPEVDGPATHDRALVAAPHR